MTVFTFESLNEGISASVEELRELSRTLLISVSVIASGAFIGETGLAAPVLAGSFCLSLLSYIVCSVPSVKKKKVPGKATAFTAVFLSVSCLVSVAAAGLILVF